jgi:hypothetical protein
VTGWLPEPVTGKILRLASETALEDIRWVEGGSQPADMAKYKLRIDFFVHKEIIPAVNKVKRISSRISYKP